MSASDWGHSSEWGVLICDIWRYISTNFLSLGALRKLSLLNTKFLALCLPIREANAHRLAFVHDWQPLPKRTEIPWFLTCWRFISIFALWTKPNVIILAGFSDSRQTTFDLYQLTPSKITLYKNLDVSTFPSPIDITSHLNDDLLVLNRRELHVLDHTGTLKQTIDVFQHVYRISAERRSGNVAISCHKTVLILSPSLQQIRSIEVQNWTCGVALLQGEVFVVSDRSTIIVYDTATGERLRDFQISSSFDLYTDGHTALLGTSSVHSRFASFFDRMGSFLRSFQELTTAAVTSARGDLFLVVRGREHEYHIVKFSEPETY